MKYWCTVLFALCFIQASIAVEFYLNPQADCSPPRGCDFLANTTWVNGSIPTSGNNDTFYIVGTAPNYNETLIVASALIGTARAMQFDIQSIVLQNAVLVFDYSRLFIWEGVTLNNNGHLVVRNETFYETEAISAANSSQISLHERSVLLIVSDLADFVLQWNSVIYAYSASRVTCMESSTIYGDMYAYDGSTIDLGDQVNVYGNVISDVTSWIAGYNFTFNGEHETSTLAAYIVNVLDSLKITSLAQINTNLTLGNDAELTIGGGQYLSNTSTIGQVFSPTNASITIYSANVAIGSSNLSLVSLHLNGNTNLYVNQTTFGSITGSGSPTLFITAGPTNLTQSTSFTGNIVVQETASFVIGHNITLGTNDCISNYGLLEVYGTLTCFSTPYFANSSSSLTNVYGTIKAAVSVNEGATLALLGNALLDGEVDFLYAILKVNPSFIITVSETLELINSTIDVDVNKDIHHTNDSYILEVEGASFTGVKLTTTTPQGSRPDDTRTYNLLSSVNNITGQPIVDAELEHGSLAFAFPSPREIVFTYTPSHGSSEILPLWAWILIAVGGFLVLVLLIALIVKKCGKKKDYSEIAK